MRVRATAVQQRIGLGGDVFIDGRYDVQWEDGKPWLPLINLDSFTVHSWYMMLAFFEVASRRLNAELIVDDRTIPIP